MALKRFLTPGAVLALVGVAALVLAEAPRRSAGAATSLGFYGRVSRQTGGACPSAVAPGAVSTRAENLLALDARSVVGYSSTVQTVTQRLGACTAVGTAVLVIRVPGGTVAAEGTTYGDGSAATLAVTGGTGRYRSASGELTYAIEPQYGLRLYTLTLDRL